MNHTAKIAQEKQIFTGHRKLAELISVQKEFENEISLDENFLEAFRIFHELIFVQAGLQCLFIELCDWLFHRPISLI